MVEKITTIIPVYNALEELKRLLKSLRANYNFDLGKIVLINDCSNLETTMFLQEFDDSDSRFILINNEENLGFVKTCNRAMKMCNTDFIVLLNSDTEIPSMFCEKIIDCFNSDSSIGLASPISSCSNSYYIPIRPNYSVEDMNEIINKNHKPVYPMLPEAEGFCFCIRKEVVEKQGYLDEVYGRGYHEEVDYAYRAITNGWRIALIDSLYVYHKSVASFGKNECENQKKLNNSVFYSRWEGFRDKYKRENKLVNPCIEIEKEVFGNQIPLNV